MDYMYWDGSWLYVSGPPETTTTPPNWLPLWEFKQTTYDGPLGGEVGSVLLSVSGGEMVERRPDRVDCDDVPHDLLGVLMRNQPDARIARVRIPRPDKSAVFGVVVEGHAAVFYKRHRLPIAPRASLQIPAWTELCDVGRGSPQWLTFWRCGECGGFVVQATGTGRVGEYFTETINKQFEKIYEDVEVPDWYLLPTCMDCGNYTVTKNDADLIRQIQEGS